MLYLYSINPAFNSAFFAGAIVRSLQLGSLYALIALGYTMVYGIIRLINFAHGEVFMVGAFAAYFLFSLTPLAWPVAVIGPDSHLRLHADPQLLAWQHDRPVGARRGAFSLHHGHHRASQHTLGWRPWWPACSTPACWA